MKQKTKMVLGYLQGHNNTATTHDITVDTQLDNDQVRYQFTKLEENGLVTLNIEQRNNFEVTRAKLTTKGRQKLKSAQYDRVDKNVEHLAHLIEDLDEQDIIDKDDYL